LKIILRSESVLIAYSLIPKGYAMVEYEKKQEAERAINGLNGSSLLQRELQVDWAFAVEKDTRI
jgi:RNA recognition motif-containing protein